MLIAGLAILWPSGVMIRSMVVGNPPPAPIAAPGPQHERAILLDAYDKYPFLGDTWDSRESTFESAELSVGPWVRMCAPGWPFHRITYRSDLHDLITPFNEWVAPLFSRGRIIGAIQVLPPSSAPGDRYYVTTMHDKEFGSRLLALGDGERLLEFTPHGAWFVQSGDRVAPFDDYSEMYIEGDQPLTALRDHIADWRRDGPGFSELLLRSVGPYAYLLIEKSPLPAGTLCWGVIALSGVVWLLAGGRALASRGD